MCFATSPCRTSRACWRGSSPRPATTALPTASRRRTSAPSPPPAAGAAATAPCRSPRGPPQADGVAVGERAWGLVTPAHWLLGRDHATMLDPAGLGLSEAESRALFEAIRGLFESEGFAVAWGAPERWYVGHDELEGFADRLARSRDRPQRRPLAGRDRARPSAGAIRRLQSEAQLVFHAHPVNEAREARGEPVVNSFWLSGCGRAQAVDAAAEPSVDASLRAPLLAGDWAGLGRGLAAARRRGDRPRRRATRRDPDPVRRAQRRPLRGAAAGPAAAPAPALAGGRGARRAREPVRTPMALPPLTIETRDVPPRTAWALEQAGVHPLLARLFAARGVRAADELDDGLARCCRRPACSARPPPPSCSPTRSAPAAGSASSPTTTATAPPPARSCCAACACSAPSRRRSRYVVPDRRIHGYGLTPAIVDLALEREAPDVLLTVDNGIASLEGVAHARGARARGRDHRPPPAGDRRRRGAPARRPT